MSRQFKRRKNPFKNNRSQLSVETLEQRALPSTTITGYAYYDQNNDGAFEPGETPIANSTIQLQNSSGQVIGTTTTDANGFYQFSTDQSQPPTDATQTQDVSFYDQQTDFSQTESANQFDPSLGVLTSVELVHNGTINSQIQVENLSPDSGSHITGNVSGVMNLSGPGVNDNLNLSSPAGSFDASVFDGSNDFSGSSGTSFGQQTANNSDDITITDPTALAAFTGAGTVDLTESATATSNATGGGNLEVNVQSDANADVTVIYHYKAYAPLQPGNYTIVQTQIPPGYTPGIITDYNGTVWPTSPTAPETIPITIDGISEYDNNNFGELMPTSISGYVYSDANNNGVMDSGETGIGGVTMTLTGSAGNTLTATTDSSGFYHFDTLTPDTYTLTESSEPAGFLPGMVVAGTDGGFADPTSPGENVSSITVNSGDQATDYDFGKVQAASLSGTVYVDKQKDGQLDPGDPGIANDTITLTGFDDNGPVNLTTTTASDGTYSFDNLRPGTYAISQDQPNGYNVGATTVGSEGGTAATNSISDITLNAGVDGTGNNFGELGKGKVTPPNPGPKDVGPFGMIPIFEKNQLLANPTLDNLDPAMVGNIKFVVGTMSTLTGQSPNLGTMLSEVQSLQSGLSPANFINQVYTSNAARTQQVDKLYQSILQREPTGQELASTIQELNSGTDPVTLMQTLYTSSEYQGLHATPDALATALSQNILGSTPSSTDEQTLVQDLGTQSLSAVVSNLLTSTGSLSNLIDNEYLLVLRRHASNTEIQTWTPQLQAGTTTLDGIAKSLFNTQEFYQLAYNRVH